MPVKLSPSALSVFKDCPRCFWLERRQDLKRPRGVFPSLPGGMDRRLKEWYDKYRAEGKLPPEVSGQLPGQLYSDQQNLELWRSWRTGLQAQVSPEAIVSGALDDLLHEPKAKTYHVLDYKTRGSPPVPGDTEKYYSTQGDAYALMLEANKLPPGPKACFVYYWPVEVGLAAAGELSSAGVRFRCEVVQVEAQPQRAAKLALAATACLVGPIPGGQPKCEVCNYPTTREAVEEQLRRAA